MVADNLPGARRIATPRHPMTAQQITEAQETISLRSGRNAAIIAEQLLVCK
jgi:hypothetical protein